jgi:hypothetical protein
MFRGKLMLRTRMIVAMRKIFWRPMLKILRKRRERGAFVIKDSLIVLQNTGRVLQAIRYTAHHQPIVSSHIIALANFEYCTTGSSKPMFLHVSGLLEFSTTSLSLALCSSCCR